MHGFGNVPGGRTATKKVTKKSVKPPAHRKGASGADIMDAILIVCAVLLFIHFFFGA